MSHIYEFSWPAIEKRLLSQTSKDVNFAYERPFVCGTDCTEAKRSRRNRLHFSAMKPMVMYKEAGRTWLNTV